MIQKVSLMILSLLLLSACGKTKSADELLPSENSTCDGVAITTDFIVEYEDGSRQVVKYDSKKELRDEFVVPNLEKIKRIEYDQKFEIKNDFSPRAVSSINNWGYENTNVADLWQAGHRGANIVVAVIDSGVEVEHDHLVNQIFINAGEIADNGIDDDGNGYVDDVTGYDFFERDNSPNDELFHGTHVAGVIAAEHSNSSVEDEVVLSMAPSAKIMPLKFLGTGGGTLSAAIEAIDYAADNGAKIINASWGGSGCSAILRDRVAQLDQEGVLFVAAAGNSGANIDVAPEFPAAFSGTLQLTVGSITQFGGMSSFSNYSDSLVHLFAPGTGIVSTVPGNDLMEMSGTSMATPFVAGAAAAIWSANPSWSLSQVRTVILQSITTNSRFRNLTQGRLDLSQSLQFL